MIEKELSQRLRLVASFLPKGANFADIGSDHAYLPCYVCSNDKTAKAIAGEINEGPYQNALKTVELYGLKARIDVRKGNGLEVVAAGEVDQITISGMGGTLITQILEDGKAKLKNVERIVVQPNVDAISIRKWFLDNQYTLFDEKIVKEDGHIYEILVADKDKPARTSPYSKEAKQKLLLFGPYLLIEKSAAFIEKWRDEKEKRKKAIAQMKKATVLDNQKIAQFKAEIDLIEEVLNNE